MASSSLQEATTVQLPFAAVAVPLARRLLVADLKEAFVPQQRIDDARVVLSELMANSIRHARPLGSGQLQASWLVDPRGITLSVSDGGGDTRPEATRAAPLALGGRGLSIVEALCADWSVATEDTITTVYATIAL